MASHKNKKHQKIIIYLSLFVIVMLGFGYALVPLYNVLCQWTGINGKTSVRPDPLAQTAIDESRSVTVEFVTSLNATLPWKFYPLVKKIHIHPGENKQMTYYVENDSGVTMTVQAIPSVTPGEAAKYLKKTECFCFNQQTLKNGESAKLPMIFHLDVALPKEIKTLTLAYTLFDASGVKPRPKIDNNFQTGD